MRRVPGSYQRAIDGIKRTKDAGLLAGISTYATPERLSSGQVVEMIELAGSLGADEITIFDVVPTGRLLHEDRKHLLSDEDKDELCRLEDRYNRDNGLPHVITQAHVNGPTGVGCYAGWCQFYVTAFGDMTPCDFTPLSFGSVAENPVSEVWRAMISHEEYCRHRSSCRMQNPEFRARLIDRLPLCGPFPYPVADIASLPDAPPEQSEPASGEAYTSIGIKG
jgi:MoaA/NifB/PqqE/SkfB family radical SAM enzyme